MNKQAASYWIGRLGLTPHPEGGYYREMFRSAKEIFLKSGTELRQTCTSIHYLLEGTDFSGFHRLESDEIWYWHYGEPVSIYMIDPDGKLEIIRLSDQTGDDLSAVILSGTWFAASIPSGQGFVLVSCMVAPAFRFEDFEMANAENLIQQFPLHRDLIKKYSR